MQRIGCENGIVDAMREIMPIDSSCGANWRNSGFSHCNHFFRVAFDLGKLAPTSNAMHYNKNGSGGLMTPAREDVQPLTEPATRPDTIHFWQKMKNMNTGSNASTVMVMKLGQSVEN